MKKILFTLCLALSLSTMAWAGNRNTELRSLVSSYKGTEGFDIVNVRGPMMSLLRAAARSEADDPEDRAALDLLSKLKSITVVDFSEAAPQRREAFLQKARKILSRDEVLLEARDGEDHVCIYGVVSDKRIQDIVILADDALISFRGSIRSDQIDALMSQAKK